VTDRDRQGTRARVHVWVGLGWVGLGWVGLGLNSNQINDDGRPARVSGKKARHLWLGVGTCFFCIRRQARGLSEWREKRILS
jgi:hypothetical protein